MNGDGTNGMGDGNTAIGASSLINNDVGQYNTAIGHSSLFLNMGSSNIALGFQAGYSTGGSNNIVIGNVGASGDNNTIRIGNATHGPTYIAGIANTPLTGSPVVITPSGQLGFSGSSERYKTAITTMGSTTAKLQLLRPVTFRFKNEPQGVLQYGLIAEEVDKVYPELVIHDEAGKLQGVRYDELAPMLLNEVQQQHLKLTAQAERMAALQRNLSDQAEKLTAQAQHLHDMQLQLAEVKELTQQLATLKELKQSVPASLVRLQTKNGHGDGL